MPLFKPRYYPSSDKFLYFFGDYESWERLIKGNCKCNREVYLFNPDKPIEDAPKSLKIVKSKETLKRVLYHVSLSNAIVFIDLHDRNANINEISTVNNTYKVVFKIPLNDLKTYCYYHLFELTSKRTIEYMIKYR